MAYAYTSCVLLNGDNMRHRLLLIPLFLLLAGCLSPQGAPENPPSGGEAGLSEEALLRTSAGKAVSVDAAFLNPLQKNDEELVFKIYMNTHSVDLSGFRIESLTTFRSSEGLETKEGFNWVSESDSSHHRSGYLIIPSRKKDGTPLITSGTEYIVLEVQGIEMTRTFRWGREALEQLR